MGVALNSNQSLSLWRDITEYLVSQNSEVDLSLRQMAILMRVYTSDSSYTVRELSRIFHISKPAVTRALNHLSRLGLIRRKVDPDDKRSVFVQKTVRGSVFLSDFGDTVCRYAERL